jgi:hypothetical protein
MRCKILNLGDGSAAWRILADITKLRRIRPVTTQEIRPLGMGFDYLSVQVDKINASIKIFQALCLVNNILDAGFDGQLRMRIAIKDNLAAASIE